MQSETLFEWNHLTWRFLTLRQRYAILLTRLDFIPIVEMGER